MGDSELEERLVARLAEEVMTMHPTTAQLAQQLAIIVFSITGPKACQILVHHLDVNGTTFPDALVYVLGLMDAVVNLVKDQTVVKASSIIFFVTAFHKHMPFP